ncbi:MAG: low molecular weight phosphotyrosine protein phosphatase [Pseudomonadales bacterium]|uniref:protein-tyrosine-phosphatase n=1 Tax=Oleiphilus messinensis TaxID=141451 RepID=A0A1Y0I9T6_9GAMM|nr:low molecular weight protein-tyrosine-phosphatase [Oleiphilus messinensis]ARU56153.1 low molecular weight phosphotyrosine protein phosphatase [Oleiphilus messinensis]MCG8609318.1 low molecular weight phosphotyrosine protein phosphatase [Pseudomonadales bacterium]
MVKVLFVCLGNICRSPTAHGVFRSVVEREGLAAQIEIESAGTGPWHVGKTPDSRAIETAKKRGIDMADLRARQVADDDFEYFDYIFAMDQSNYENLIERCPAEFQNKVSLFLSLLNDNSIEEVPDPYYGGRAGFELVFDLVTNASEALLKQLIDTRAIASS